MAENDLAEVDDVGDRTWVMYPSFVFSNILIDPQRTCRCVKAQTSYFTSKDVHATNKINSIYLYLLDV